MRGHLGHLERETTAAAARRWPYSFDAAWPQIDRSEGWLAREEAEILFTAARRVPPGQWIVEVGSFRGRSTTALALGKRDGVPVLAIDPLSGSASPDEDPDLRAFLANLGRVGAASDVQLFLGTSLDAAARWDAVTETARRRAARSEGRVFRVGAASSRSTRRTIGLLFVDGLHDRASVLADIDAWTPLVADGGTVVFHDAFFRRGVTEAILARMTGSREFRYVGGDVTACVFRREPRLSRGERVASGARLAARLAHFARNAATLLAVRREWDAVQRVLTPREEFEYRSPEQLVTTPAERD